MLPLIAILSTFALSVAPNPSYIGCFVDSPSNDMSNHHAIRKSNFEACLTNCRTLGFPYMGLEYEEGDFVCRCDSKYGKYGQVSNDECDYNCPEGPSCGSTWRNSIYLTGITTQTLKIDNNQILSYWTQNLYGATYLGCYNDEKSPDSDLDFATNTDLTFDEYETISSIRDCFEFCHSFGFKYAGLQGGDGCYCGNSYGKYSKENDNVCNFECPDGNHMCGSTAHNSIYDLTNYIPISAIYDVKQLGCYYDAPYRAMSFNYSFPSYVDPIRNYYMAKSTCLSICRSQGYKYMGLEYLTECYCSNSYGIYGKATLGECEYTCLDTNDTSSCGGDWRLTVYTTGISKDDYKPPSNTAVLSQNKNIYGAVYMGCFLDDEPRDLNFGGNEQLIINAAIINEPKECFEYCSLLGFTYAGLQWSYQCFCGNSYGAYGMTPYPLTCNFKCANTSFNCGGEWANMVYDITEYKPTSTLLETNYVGCFVDGFPSDIGYNSSQKSYSMVYDAVPIHACLSTCRQRGFNYMGLEGGTTCRCGNNYGHYGKDNDRRCNEECFDKQGASCGGRMRNAVYLTGLTATELSIDNSLIVSSRHRTYYNAMYIGCYKSVNTRKNKLINMSRGNLRQCLEHCHSVNQTIAAISNEDGTCFCPATTNAYAKDSSEFGCNMECRKGVGSCGGIGHMSLYNVTDYTDDLSIGPFGGSNPMGTRASPVPTCHQTANCDNYNQNNEAQVNQGFALFVVILSAVIACFVIAYFVIYFKGSKVNEYRLVGNQSTD